MKDFNLNEEELKELLKSSITEESSSDFTEQMMLKIVSVQEEQITRKLIQSKRRNILVIFSLAAAFIVNMIFLFSNRDIILQDLLVLLEDHFIIQLMGTTKIVIASVGLAFSSWILVFIDKKISATD